MNLRIHFLLLVLFVPQVVFCEDEKKSEEGARETVYLRVKNGNIDTEDALNYLLEQHIKKNKTKIILVEEQQKAQEKQQETFSQTMNQVAFEAAPHFIPHALSFLINLARGMACDAVVYYFVGDNYKNVTRVGLEGLSHVALQSLSRGSPDENGNFKFYFDKELLVDGINASAQYAFMAHVVDPFVRKQLQPKYPELNKNIIVPSVEGYEGYDEWRKERAALEMQHKANILSRMQYVWYINQGAALLSNEVYNLSKDQVKKRLKEKYLQQ